MEALSPTRRRAIAGAALLVGALVLGGRWLADAGAPAAPAPAAPVAIQRAAARPVLVHVVGAVRDPGLYELKDGDRVADAVERAGGTTKKADLSALNLAAPVADGMQVVVPARTAAGGGATAAGAAAAGGKVSLSRATVADLDALPGIGPVTAQKIIDYRQAHGAFRSVDELDAVPGIGPARLEQLRELVTP